MEKKTEYSNKQVYQLYFTKLEQDINNFYSHLDLTGVEMTITDKGDDYDYRRELEELLFQQEMENYWNNFNN